MSQGSEALCGRAAAATEPVDLNPLRAKVGRRHLGTLMRRMGIEALAPQPGTSKRPAGQKIYLHLLRKLAIARA